MNGHASEAVLRCDGKRVHCTNFKAADYDLAATLNSGQAFRWVPYRTGWQGVVHGRWVWLTQDPSGIHAVCAVPQTEWNWLEDYLQISVRLGDIQALFPPDPALAQAIQQCRGLRLLRQEPWECLASFILSSTKQIPQIRRGIERIADRFGEPVPVLDGGDLAKAFPGPAALAQAAESELRQCGIGFRAPNLLEAARRVAQGQINLGELQGKELGEARETLMRLPGVGRKIADCVLLFAYDFPTAFPVDVWVKRALQELYFSQRNVPVKELERFVESHFGPQAGYAQQYLFHFMRMRGRRASGIRT